MIGMMPERPNGKDSIVAPLNGAKLRCAGALQATSKCSETNQSRYNKRLSRSNDTHSPRNHLVNLGHVLQDLEGIAFSHTSKQIHEETDRPDKQGVQADRHDSTNKKWLQGKNGRVQSLRMTRLTRFQSHVTSQNSANREILKPLALRCPRARNFSQQHILQPFLKLSV